MSLFTLIVFRLTEFFFSQYFYQTVYAYREKVLFSLLYLMAITIITIFLTKKFGPKMKLINFIAIPLIMFFLLQSGKIESYVLFFVVISYYALLYGQALFFNFISKRISNNNYPALIIANILLLLFTGSLSYLKLFDNPEGWYLFLIQIIFSLLVSISLKNDGYNYEQQPTPPLALFLSFIIGAPILNFIFISVTESSGDRILINSMFLIFYCGILLMIQSLAKSFINKRVNKQQLKPKI